MKKYHNVSHSVQEIVVRIATAQMGFRIDIPVTILKTIRDIMGYIVMFNNIQLSSRDSEVALYLLCQ